MKTKHVYVINSLKEENFLIFGARERAEKWLKNPDFKIFNKSSKKDLFITSRIVF